jgi:hypothetical protein
MAKVILDGAIICGNAGGGLLVVGDGHDISAVGMTVMSNGGDGVCVRPQSLVEKLGFSNELPADELADILTQLLTVAPEERAQAIIDRGFAEKLGAFFVGATTVTANLVAILADGGVANIIRELWRSVKA